MNIYFFKIYITLERECALSTLDLIIRKLNKIYISIYISLVNYSHSLYNVIMLLFIIKIGKT